MPPKQVSDQYGKELQIGGGGAGGWSLGITRKRKST